MDHISLHGNKGGITFSAAPSEHQARVNKHIATSSWSKIPMWITVEEKTIRVSTGTGTAFTKTLHYQSIR